MKINQISFTIKFSPINDLQKNYYDKRNILENDFCPAMVYPIPDDGFPEIPRIAIESLHGHSQITISKTALIFSVIKIDNGYETSLEQCIEYLNNKKKIILTFLNEILDKDSIIEYSGLIANLTYDSKDPVCETLSDNLLKRHIDKIYDISVRYTFVKDSKYFINLQVQNQRIYNNRKDDSAGGLSNNNLSEENIGVLIDINDRYAFNNNKNYKSDLSLIERMTHLMSGIIHNKIELLISGGEYNVD